MSVGQIYRYFPSKEAIVHAIVERIVSKRLQWMLNRNTRVNFAAVFAHRCPMRSAPDEQSDRILLLEATAEASRNPAVAAIVREADRRIHRQAEELVSAEYPECTAAEIAARVEFMAVLSEGSGFRRVTEQSADPAVLEAIYRDALRVVFPRMTEEGMPG